jgi:hypothetical protein
MQSGRSADLKRPYTFVYVVIFLWLRALGRASHPPMLAVKVKSKIQFVRVSPSPGAGTVPRRVDDKVQHIPTFAS